MPQKKGARYVFAGSSNELGGTQTKTCPRCGSELFEDMDVCYGCLYDFSRNRNQDGAPSDTLRAALAGKTPGDALEGVELDEPTDDLPAEPPQPGGSGQSALRPAPRHRKGVVSSADDTIDLGAPGAQDDDPVEQVCSFVRVCTEGMEVTLPIPREGLRIGRDAGNDVVLCSRRVSRSHARVIAQEGSVVVEDMGATNPMLVDGRELVGSVTLGEESVVEICGTTLMLERR